jgi:hypothetical protein
MLRKYIFGVQQRIQNLAGYLKASVQDTPRRATLQCELDSYTSKGGKGGCIWGRHLRVLEVAGLPVQAWR